MDNFKITGYKPNIKKIKITPIMSAVLTEKSNRTLIGSITTNGRKDNALLLSLDDADSYCFL
ncbi:hypothetical protein GCM10027286_28590 [Virgibacillus ainsalahensis]